MRSSQSHLPAQQRLRSAGESISIRCCSFAARFSFLRWWRWPVWKARRDEAAARGGKGGVAVASSTSSSGDRPPSRAGVCV